MVTMPGGSPTSSVPSMSKLTSVTIVRVPNTCSLSTRRASSDKRRQRACRANDFVDFDRLAVYRVQSRPLHSLDDDDRGNDASHHAAPRPPHDDALRGAGVRQ